MTVPVVQSPMAEPPRRSAAPAGRTGRIALVLALLAALVPAVIAGRHATAQDSSGTPEASPVAQTTVAGVQTASVVPADALLFAALTVDPTSGQITQSQELLDRAGLGDLVDSLFAEAVPETIGASSDDSPVDTTTGASADATPVAGDAEPDLGVILDGEVAVAVGDQVIETFGESLDEGADSVAAAVEDAGATVAEPTVAVPEEVIEEVAENSAEVVEEAVEGTSDDDADDAEDGGPLDNIGASDVEDDEDAEESGDASDSPAADVEPAQPSADVEAALSGVVVVVRPGDPDAAAAEIDAMLLESSRSSDTAIEETEASGVTISSLPPDGFGSDGIAVARLGDLFVVSGTPADLEPYAAVFAGEAPALDADPAFVKARTELPDDFLAFGFVNGPAIVTALEPVLAEASEELAAAGLPEGGFSPEQLAQLRAYNAFIVRADTPGFRFETAMFAAEGDTLPALPDGGEVTLDAEVPGDSLVFMEGFELGATLAPSLDAVALMIAQAAMQDPDAALLIPEGATDEEKIAAVNELLARIVSFDPRTQLIDQMTGEWAFALTVRSLTDPSGVGAVFTSGVNDPTLVTDATTKLAAYVNVLAVALTFSSDNPVQILANTEAGAQTETVGDGLTQVITIPIPPSVTGLESDTPVDQTEADEPVPTVRLQWGIVDGRFVFGVNEGFTEYVEGTAGGALADNPRYQAIMAELPEPSNGVFYLDLGQLITLLEPVLFGDPGAMPACDTTVDDDCLATPIPSTAEAPDLSGIEALAAVSYARGDVRGVSALLMIGE